MPTSNDIAAALIANPDFETPPPAAATAVPPIDLDPPVVVPPTEPAPAAPPTEDLTADGHGPGFGAVLVTPDSLALVYESERQRAIGIIVEFIQDELDFEVLEEDVAALKERILGDVAVAAPPAAVSVDASSEAHARFLEKIAEEHMATAAKLNRSEPTAVASELRIIAARIRRGEANTVEG